MNTNHPLALKVSHLSVAYGANLVLESVDLAVPRGVIMGLVGPNGAGKSTLLKATLGLVPVLSGDIEFFGQSLEKQRNQVAYMPQTASIDWDFPIKVLDVVQMGTYSKLGWLKRAKRIHRIQALNALAQVGMSEFANRQIGALSGGQRQRVFLARALVQEADLLFMDEPFQGVDATSQKAILDIMIKIRNEGKTVVLVHHDLTTVSAYCDEVTLINKTVKASGPTQSTITAQNIKSTYEVPVDFELPK